jgi:hypothetical protein
LRVTNQNFFTGAFSNTKQCGQDMDTDNCEDEESNYPQTNVWTWNSYNQIGNTSTQTDFPANYRIGQVIEGGSVYQYIEGIQYYDSKCQTDGSNDMNLVYTPSMAYFSPSYRTITSPGTTYPTVNFSNKNRIVVRSNRMPTSTNEQISGPNSFQLHQNSTFAIYRLSDTGGVQELENVTQFPTNSDNESANAFVPFTNVLESVNNCEKAVMLSCYGTDENGNPLTGRNGGCFFSNPLGFVKGWQTTNLCNSPTYITDNIGLFDTMNTSDNNWGFTPGQKIKINFYERGFTTPSRFKIVTFN